MSTKISIVFGLLVGLFLILHGPVLAVQNFDTVYLPENETVNGLYFKTGTTITIDGTVNGEAYLFGQNVIVNGNINGDLIAGGGTVTVNGNISENVRAVGGTVSVSGHVGKNALVMAAQSEVEKNGKIDGNLVNLSNNTLVLGMIGGETQIFAQNIFYNSKSGQNVKLYAQDLIITKESTFSGNLDYQTQKEIPDLKKQVAGIVNFQKTGKTFVLPGANEINSVKKIGPVINWIGFLNYLIIGFLLTFIFPKQFTNVNKFLGEKPLASAVGGIVFYVFAPFILLILAITIIGIPLAILFGLGTVFLAFISRIVVGLYLGGKILNDGESKFLPLLVGLAVIHLAALLPYAGFVIKIIIVFVGTGAILLSKGGKYVK